MDSASKRLWLKTGLEGFAAIAMRMAERGPSLGGTSQAKPKSSHKDRKVQ